MTIIRGNINSSLVGNRLSVLDVRFKSKAAPLLTSPTGAHARKWPTATLSLVAGAGMGTFPFFLDSILWRPDAALLVVALGVVGDNRIHARCIRNVVSSLAHVLAQCTLIPCL